MLLPSPLTVFTTNNTRFINLSGPSALMGSQPIPIRAVGFILIDPSTSQPVLVARSVEELNQWRLHHLPERRCLGSLRAGKWHRFGSLLECPDAPESSQYWRLKASHVCEAITPPF